MKKKSMVKYDNNFNIANLNDLSKIEQDIFMTICSKFSSEKKEQIEIPYEEIKADAELSLRKYSNSKFRDFMISTQSKILRINFSVLTDEGLEQRPLFRRFFTPKNKECTLVRLDDLFLEYLYNIPQKIAFSQFELDRFLELKSKYSKTLLRFFLQNFSGKWTVKFSDLKFKLGLPKSRNTSQHFAQIDKSISELENTGFITGIKYSVLKARRAGSPIDTVTFTYTINKEKQAELEGQQKLDFELATEEVVKVNHVLGLDENLKVTGKTETHTETKVLNCPRCGGSLITKTKKDGGKYHCCTNSRYWKLGSADCEFYEDIEST